MKIFTPILIAIATIFIITGCGGGSANNPIITDLGTLSFVGQTVVYAPSAALVGQLQPGTVYCTLTKGTTVITHVDLTPITNTNNWEFDFSGDTSSELYQTVLNGEYIGEYQLAVKIYVNNEEKIVANNYQVPLNFIKSDPGGVGPPPPPW